MPLPPLDLDDLEFEGGGTMGDAVSPHPHWHPNHWNRGTTIVMTMIGTLMVAVGLAFSGSQVFLQVAQQKQLERLTDTAKVDGQAMREEIASAKEYRAKTATSTRAELKAMRSTLDAVARKNGVTPAPRPRHEAETP